MGQALEEGILSTKWYVAMAVEVDICKQSDYLFLITKAGKVIGYAAEFESYTTDIADACAPETARQARWFRDEEQEWTAATFEEIRAAALDQYLIGWKRELNLTEPVEPLPEVDLRRLRAKRALAHLQRTSSELGNDTMTMNEIDAEIAAARADRGL